VIASGCGGGDSDKTGSDKTGSAKTEVKEVPKSDIPELTFESFDPAKVEDLGSGYLKDFVRTPENNPWTREKAELGRHLYFDKRLSKDGTIACATCHDPAKGWTDQAPVSTGINGQKGGRSAPTVINRVFSTLQFWDGREPNLEGQAVGPIHNPIEMGETHDGVVAKLGKIAGYKPLFQAAFGDETVTIERVGQAIASFERTVVAYDSPWDRSKRDPKKWPLSAAAARGEKVFLDQNKGRCGLCHSGQSFTDEDFHNIGVGMDDHATADQHLGRGAITKNAKDNGAYKTPTLRNITETGPYMHDGSVKTLEEVVDFYVKGGAENPKYPLDEKMKKLTLTDQEKSDLVEFMKALTGRVTTVKIPMPVQ